jgi:3-methyladenine DNA glycosylase AlkD
LGLKPKAIRDLARQIEARLEKEGSDERAASVKAYMKTDLELFGVPMPMVRKLAQQIVREHELDHDDLFALVSLLYATDNFDARSLAIAILEKRKRKLGPEDLEPLVELVHRSGCWAHVDWLAATIIPVALSQHRRPEALRRKWAKDPDLWLRRTSLLCDLTNLRKGGGDFELFSELAAGMIHEKEFFIRKAIGWILREVSKKRPELVQAFLSEYRPKLSGVTRREAEKYLPR